MKKSADISKFDLDWQVFRVGLKKLTTHLDKAEAAANYLIEHPNRADKERVLNYLEGLSMAYKGQQRSEVLDIKEALKQMNVTDDNPAERDFETYDNATLKGVAKDLLVRTKKWLLKGYRHEEQIEFLRSLLIHIGDEATLAELDALIRRSLTIPNTHKFFF